MTEAATENKYDKGSIVAALTAENARNREH